MLTNLKLKLSSQKTVYDKLVTKVNNIHNRQIRLSKDN